MIDVFVSCPTALSASQAEFADRLFHVLAERGLRPRALGRTDFANTTPLEAVRSIMRECRGVIVLGMTQMVVEIGVQRPETARAQRVGGLRLPTPWNDLEAGIAYGLGLPLLLIKEKGIDEGVFGIGSTDRFVHETDLSVGWLEAPPFRQPFNAWCDEVGAQARSCRK